MIEVIEFTHINKNPYSRLVKVEYDTDEKLLTLTYSTEFTIMYVDIEHDEWNRIKNLPENAVEKYVSYHSDFNYWNFHKRVTVRTGRYE